MNPLLNMIRNVVALARVDRPSGKPQVKWFGDRATPAVPHMQGPGVFFIPALGSYGVILSPSADPAAARFVGGDGDHPADPEPGEGGLHYLGTWRLFVAADGTLHLGEKDPADFVALASLVKARLDAIQAAFDQHVHVTTCPSGAGTAAVTAAPIGPLADVASTKVKCA